MAASVAPVVPLASGLAGVHGSQGAPGGALLGSAPGPRRKTAPNHEVRSDLNPNNLADAHNLDGHLIGPPVCRSSAPVGAGELVRQEFRSCANSYHGVSVLLVPPTCL